MRETHIYMFEPDNMDPFYISARKSVLLLLLQPAEYLRLNHTSVKNVH